MSFFQLMKWPGRAISKGRNKPLQIIQNNSTGKSTGNTHSKGFMVCLPAFAYGPVYFKVLSDNQLYHSNLLPKGIFYQKTA